MVNILLSLVTVVELVLIAIGVGIAIRVARIASRPPMGWVLLTISFALGFVRGSVYLYIFLGGSSADFWTSVAEVITFPVVVLVLSGVYYLYVDFKRGMGQKQGAILVPQEPAPEKSG